MFRLSTKSDYGLILLSTLNRASVHPRGVPGSGKAHPGGESGFVSISSVAKKNKISSKFLSQIAQELKKAGFITAKEGVSGGYTLAKTPDQIRLLDVLKVLDGDLVVGKCFEDDHECVCGAGDMFAQMREQLEATIGKKTVADLVNS